MRTYLLFLTVLIIFSCNNSKDDQQNNSAAPQALHVKTINKNLVVNDTTPRPKSNRIVDTSRPKSEIVQNYPFDINLKNAEGKLFSSGDILKKNGKPTIVLFWLTTCYPCRIEMAAIKNEFAFWKQQADFNLVAISTDFEKNFPKFKKMVNENKWPWKTYHDVNREFRKVLPGELNGLPQTFVFDGDGNIALHKRKYSSGDEDILFEKIKELAN